MYSVLGNIWKQGPTYRQLLLTYYKRGIVARFLNPTRYENMDRFYNLALFDRSQVDNLIEALHADEDHETLLPDAVVEHILSSDKETLAAELDEATRIHDPKLYEINNIIDADFVRARNKARRDHTLWSLFVDNFVGEDE